MDSFFYHRVGYRSRTTQMNHPKIQNSFDTWLATTAMWLCSFIFSCISVHAPRSPLFRISMPVRCFHLDLDHFSVVSRRQWIMFWHPSQRKHITTLKHRYRFLELHFSMEPSVLLGSFSQVTFTKLNSTFKYDSFLIRQVFCDLFHNAGNGTALVGGHRTAFLGQFEGNHWHSHSEKCQNYWINVLTTIFFGFEI